VNFVAPKNTIFLLNAARMALTTIKVKVKGRLLCFASAKFVQKLNGLNGN
jgi:hypothetical protein